MQLLAINFCNFVSVEEYSDHKKGFKVIFCLIYHFVCIMRMVNSLTSQHNEWSGRHIFNSKRITNTTV